jgi:hypothetical protein
MLDRGEGDVNERNSVRFALATRTCMPTPTLLSSACDRAGSL